MSQIIASEFLKKLGKLSKEDLENIKGLGPILAQNILDFTSSDRYQKLVNEFTDLEENKNQITITLPVVDKNHKLNGKTIVITGSFDVSRDKIKEALEHVGAKVSSQVSKNTDILVCGEAAGSKLAKAEKLQIAIVKDLKELDIKLDL